MSDWSIARVLIVSLAWPVLVIGWEALRFYLLFRRTRADSARAGSGGIGAVSVGLPGVVAIMLAPPILLLNVWLVPRYWHRA